MNENSTIQGLQERIDNLSAEQRKLLEKRLDSMSVKKNSHDNIILLNEGGDQALPPIFCLHPPLGIATYFHNLTRYLDSNFTVYAVNSPALEDINVVLNDIGKMAALYLQMIADIAGDKKIVLFGHSSGAYMAYEMARQLVANGQEPPVLVFVDAFAPLGEPDALMAAYNTPDVHDNPDAAYVTCWLVGLACKSELPFTRDELCEADEADRYAMITAFMKESGFVSKNADQDVIRCVLQMIANHAIADMDYFARFNPDGPGEKLDATLLLVRGTEETEWPGFNITTPPDTTPFSEWDKFFSSNINLLEIKGADHLTIMMEPLTEEMAKDVQTFLDSVIS